MRCLVLGGGQPPEREVSLRSAAAVAANLEALGHEVTRIDPAEYSDHDLIARINEHEVVFPVLHGVGGEDGSIQELLEQTAIPFFGSSSDVSRRCFHKLDLKNHLIPHGLPFAQGHLVDSLSFYTSHLSKRPYVLKPVASGSSIDTHVVHDITQPSEKLHGHLVSYREMLLEELVEGIEITVPVLGNTALPVIEIVPPTGEEFDYTNKYNGRTQELCPAVSVSPEIQERAQSLALKAHRLSGCRHLSRTDMIVRADGSIVLLEVNTMPGMTDQSLLPKAAAVAGLDGPKLAARFLELVLTEQ